MTDEKILELAVDAFCIDYDRLDGRFTKFARAVLAAAGASDGQAEPKAWFVETPSGTVADITVNEIDAIAWHETGHIVHPLYAHPSAEIAALRERIAGMEKDAERYRWLRKTLHAAKAGGGVEVNDALMVYEEPASGEEVRIYWYPETPVGFYELKASTLDLAIDAAIAKEKQG